MTLNRSLLVLLLGLLSCTSSPSLEDSASKPSSGPVSIAYLKTLYTGTPRRITEDFQLSGYVVHNLRNNSMTGCIAITHGTAGNEVKLGFDDAFRYFPNGTPLTVRCAGLWLGAYGGVVQLGGAPEGSYETSYLSTEEIALHFSSDTLSPPIRGSRTVTIPELAPEWISTLIRLEEVQFVEDEISLTWSEEAYDTNRHLVDRNGDTLIARTSRKAQFAQLLLPSGSGTVEGVLSYFTPDYQLIVTDLRLLDMSSPRF